MPHQPTDQCSDALSYQAFLVRIWKDGATALWRCSAQSAQSGEIKRFGSLTELFQFLESQTDEIAEHAK